MDTLAIDREALLLHEGNRALLDCIQSSRERSLTIDHIRKYDQQDDAE